VLRPVDLRAPGADASVLVGAAAADDPDAVAAVREIIAAVRARGDDALRDLTARFDGATIEALRVPPEEILAARDRVDAAVRDALGVAADRIRAYHEAQARAAAPEGLDRDGVSVTEIVVPVARVGVYVPGGRAAYPSTVLMTAIPARIAGVGEVALCVPPAADGSVPAVTLAAAALAGVDEVYRVGGAQAIAALAFGTESIRPVDVVVGPGNRYVSIAKREVAGAGAVGIESPAGPSELVVVADATAPPAAVAADLAAQAEHGPGGTAVLVTPDPAVVDEVERALTELLGAAGRVDEIRSTLGTGGRAVLVRDLPHALEVANLIAPEHLELMVEDPEALLPLVRNAGAVFCGATGATALGDYVAGANHVLPTGRTARFASALRVDDFRKHVHVVRATAAGAARLAAVGAVIARAEGLDVHARSLELRGGS
jgi:histidinol dehydrogenase